jgi:hypothetical protein
MSKLSLSQAWICILTRNSYDEAITKHVLSSSESFITCLSIDCGLHFSIDDCKLNEDGKQTIACPYCEYESCLECNRSWESHGKGGCDKAKQAEDKEGEATIRRIGAKPCPKCGLNIQEAGGCDHITCKSQGISTGVAYTNNDILSRQCCHSFCWQCLASYAEDAQHLENCSHFRVRIAAEPDNWVPDGLTEAQLNEVIRRADALRDPDEPNNP